MLTHRRLGALATATAALLAAYVVARATLPHGLPLGVVILGLAFGLLNALGAVALILVYRAGGYVNFAQASFGAVGAALTYELTTAYHWAWLLAVTLGLLAAIALSILAEILFIQRLFTAPRLYPHGCDDRHRPVRGDRPDPPGPAEDRSAVSSPTLLAVSTSPSRSD